MKNTKIKHNKNWDWNRDFTKKEKEKFIKKEESRLKRVRLMKPEQQKIYVKSLLNRSQRKSEIKKQIIEIISVEKNLALADIHKKLGLSRNNFNYWIDKFEKEGWFEKRPLKKNGVSQQGKPKTLILNKKKIKESEQCSFKRSKKYEDKSFEAYTLTSMFIMKILQEIQENTSYNQHKKLIKLFEQFKKDKNYGAQTIFLLYSDFIKVDYKFSITDKGKRALKKLQKKKANS